MNCKKCKPNKCECNVSNFTEEKINRNAVIPVKGKKGDKGEEGDVFIPEFNDDIFDI